MEMRIKPITPAEVLDAKTLQIPSEMFEAVNELIVKHWNGSDASFRQTELVKLFLEKSNEYDTEANRTKIYDNKWMDFEDIYRKVGWIVECDKPGFN